MNLCQRFRIALGLILLLSFVAAARVAAHPPLLTALELPMRVDGPVQLTAPAPNASVYRLWDDSLRSIPPTPTLVPMGPGVLLPNWEVGRNAVVLIPNYEAGMATVQLLQLVAPPAATP